MACFVLSIFIYAVVSIVHGTMIDPSDVLIIMMMFLVIAGFNFLRSFIERSEWGRSTSLNQKNIIFAPVYFIIAIVTALIMGVPVDLTLLLILGGVFLTVFLIMNVIVYFAAKKRTDLMNDALDQDDRDYLRRMEQGLLSDVEYSRALLNLVRLLATYHQSKVVILIDEYDTPSQQGYAKGFYQDVISFMRNFLSGGLKDNPDLAFGVLTGIMRVSKENLFSGLNNPTVNTVLDEKYSQFFGFTEEEVRAMASYYGKADRMEEVRLWYDGYLFGNTSVYNPWSVTNYFSNGGQAKAYWANTSDNEIIHELMRGLTPEIADNLQSVMQGEEIHAALDMEVIYPRIADGADTIFSFLLLAGYLTTVGLPKETEFGTFAELKLPNTEVRRVYNTEILGWLRLQPAGTVIPEIEKAIYRSDGDRLQQALRKYMISCISSFDGAAEGFYHGMVLGLVASLSSRYFIRSNREAGDGRFDLQLEPKDLKLPGILMEFKAAREASDTSLSNLAEEALSQIEKKQYATELSERGVSQIVTYGIAFSGKQVVVKSGQI